MNRLIIGGNPSSVILLDNIKDMREWVSTYFNQEVIIGDFAKFSEPMRGLLLKTIEENDMLSLWSSTDISDNVLLSRFQDVVKCEHLVSFNQDMDDMPTKVALANLYARIGKKLLSDIEWSES